MTSSRALARVAAPVLWGCLLATGALPAQDSTSLLSSETPVSRFPAYLGNGELGVRTSPLGTSATPSLLAGVHEHAARDAPGIAVLPPMGLSTGGYYGHVFWDADTWMFPALLVLYPDTARSMVMFRARTLDAARRNARVIRDTAEFWVSRATRDTVRHRYDIRNVVSVDEGMVGIENDAYANAVDATIGSVVPLLAFPLGVPMHERGKRTDLYAAIRRLTLRDVPLRGTQCDIVVEGDLPRIVERAPAGAARAPGRTVSPVLAFPDPVLDDTAAYQGYETRFYRDSRGNTVQIYIDRGSGRVVHVWADAADESIGLTVRDSTGRPAAVTWGAEDATVADSGGVRTLAYRLAIASPSVRIGGVLLGSMRVERDFQYAKGHLEPFTTPTFEQKELEALIADLWRLAPDERQRQLALLHARSVGELRARLLPRIGCLPTRGCSTVRIAQSTLDGRSHLVLDLTVDPREGTLGIDGRTVTVRARHGAPIRLGVSIATDGDALTPLAREEIFDRDFLRFLARQRAAHDSVLRRLGSARPHGADSATVARYRWLEREVRSVELLSTREKLMAGLPNFATYFGRDMMMAALMMRPIWSSAMSEHVIASVLRKLGPAGDVSHEEALGAQAIRENAAVYDSLIEAWGAHRRRGERAAADSALAGARAVLGDLQRVRENYHMMDDEFQLPVLAARYLADPTVSASARRAFLVGATGPGGTSHLSALLRELALVATEAAPYVRDPSPGHLVAFARLDSAWWRSASWRDSRAGYANGRYAMDINVIWVPRALSSIADILESLRALGFDPQAIDSVLPSIARTPLAGYVRDPAAARRDAEVWRGAERYFVVTLGPREVDERVRAKLAWLPAEERSYWERVMADTASAAAAWRANDGGSDSLAFLALSLDSTGHPIPVMNTDPATRLFLDGSATGPTRDTLPEDVVLRDAAAVVRPYPVGLFVSGLGPLVANDAYASRRVWDAFAADAYHSPRVVWGREVNLIVLGLAGPIGAALDTTRAPRTPADASYVHALDDALRRIMAAVDASGFKHSELWSYRIENGQLRPTRYGTSSDIQLWSSTDLAVQYTLDRLQAP